MKGVYCGCHESYPQMRDRFVSHAPGCPLRVALEERDALRARAEAAEAKADRLAKLLERSGAMLRDLMASYETSWPDRSEILARIAAALAEKEVGE